MSKKKAAKEATALVEMSRELNDLANTRMDEVNAYHLGFIAGRKAGILEGAQDRAKLKSDYEWALRGWRSGTDYKVIEERCEQFEVERKARNRR